MAGKAIGAVMLVLLLLFFGAAAVAAAVASLNPFSGPADTTGTPSGATPSGAPVSPGAPNGGPAPGPAGPVGDIPPGYLALYQAAARQCPGLHWAVLAAVGKVETNHGRSTLPGVRAGVNPAGAAGPMQFLPATFAAVIARHPIPAGGARPPSPYDPHDAVYAAAFYLCDNGAGNPNRLAAALYRYNHSQAYVSQVLALARRYASTPDARPNTPPGTPGPAVPARPPAGTPPPAPAGSGPAVEAALAFARSQLGRPYVWGGNGEQGFDCSGLSKAAYGAAGIALPRTADAQYRAGPRLAANQNLLPGDLVFYGNPATRITHVALYIGNRQVIHASTPGTVVTIAPMPVRAYAGATRPAPAPAARQAAGPAPRPKPPTAAFTLTAARGEWEFNGALPPPSSTAPRTSRRGITQPGEDLPFARAIRTAGENSVTRMAPHSGASGKGISPIAVPFIAGLSAGVSISVEKGVCCHGLAL